MKKLFFLLVLVVSCTQMWSQDVDKTSGSANSKEDRNFRIPLIGEKAPSFSAESTNGTINFPDDFGHSWKILFSHPKDFTPVCSTEILNLAHLQSQFDLLGVKLVVISTDRLETHVQWKKALEMLKLDNKEFVKIRFPLVDDENIVVSKQYGMIHPETNSTRSVRGVFIIDPDNIIQAIYFYPMNVGRSTYELIRMIKALQTSSKDKVLMPANWEEGNDVLVRTPPKVDDNSPKTEIADYYNPAWFLWYKKVKNN
ncbi:MAG: peroxiredoxin [Bacteroidota bacterium]|nr:peroxiredoxin [Bacteroidota bacterium]